MRSRSGSARGAPAQAAWVGGGGGAGSWLAARVRRRRGAGAGAGRCRLGRGRWLARRRGGRPGSGSLTRKSSWRAPQDGQNRDRTLMRSPQLAQTSSPSLPSRLLRPLACVGRMGWYHFEAMDGGGAKLRVLAALWVATGVPRCSPRRPRRRARRPGTPKILLAFDASGSMAADDGGGTPKIQAAQDAAVDLLGSLPPSTQVGLRVFGGTKPSRPIGPACRDSSLVLPIGPLDRSQAEQQIRSFKAKGRTPIAYALEQAAQDLGTSGPRTIILVSDGKDTCQPPSPCEVARRIAKGGVEMRIQAIGFNVDQEARRELKCIASAGGGVYTDADDAQTLKEQLRVLSTRALRKYVPKGKPVRGGPNARQATAIVPGRYLDGMLPDSERWYAVELRRGETLKASASWIPPRRDIADRGTARPGQP